MRGILMAAPINNTNARKGEVNRKGWSQRLPIDVTEIIKSESKRLEISQSDFVSFVLRQYYKK